MGVEYLYEYTARRRDEGTKVRGPRGWKQSVFMASATPLNRLPERRESWPPRLAEARAESRIIPPPPVGDFIRDTQTRRLCQFSFFTIIIIVMLYVCTTIFRTFEPSCGDQYP